MKPKIDLYSSREILKTDASRYTIPSKSETREFCDKYGIPNDNRLKILMVAVAGSGGVGFYRVHQPAEYLNKHFGDKVIALDTEVITPELIYGWADIVVLSRITHPETLLMTERSKAVMVYETDDFLHG